MIIYVWGSEIGCVRGVRAVKLLILRLGLCLGCVEFIYGCVHACLMWIECVMIVCKCYKPCFKVVIQHLGDSGND